MTDGDYTGAGHTYIVATLENIREPIITEEYSLPQDLKEELLSAPSPFKNAYAECVYLRTYSRKKEDGTKERWAETVIRVIEGTIAAYLTHYKKNGLTVDPNLNDFARGMTKSLFNKEWSPPGRGLYCCGTNLVRKTGSASLNNCYACETKDLILACSWTMDNLMLGGGVSFDTSWNGEIRGPDKKDTFLFRIPDTRQGWVAALELLLRAYIPLNGIITNKFPIFDFSLIRKEGEPLRGFGGIASGPEPLKVLLNRVEIFLDTYLEYHNEKFLFRDKIMVEIWRKEIFRNMLQRLHNNDCYPCENFVKEMKDLEKALSTGKKTYGKPRLIVDIMNAIGCCVVSGNIRRSSQLALSEAGNKEFLDLKNDEINPERRPIKHISNNSFCFSKNEDFEKYIPQISERIRKNGEPGFFNLINAQKYGRITDEKYGKDKGNLLNPCVTGDTLVLTDEGEKRVDCLHKSFFAIVDGKKYFCSGFWKTGEKQVYEIILKNGMKVRATEDHKFLLINHTTQWVPVKNLTTGYKLRILTDYINITDPPYSEITGIIKQGVESVYDCQVNTINAFSANGILAHNCGEIILESFEPCCLANVVPVNCLTYGEIDMEKVLQAGRYATFYASVVTTIRHHSQYTNCIIARNRRIGIALTGISDIYETKGLTYLTTLARHLYHEIRNYNTDFASKSGIPRSIRVTTCKPDGSLSIILEVSGCGVHFPLCSFAKRRIALSKNSELLQPLIEAGYQMEESCYDPYTIYVIFPLEFKGRSVRDVSLFEQFGIVSALQRCYSDNSISFTGSFSLEKEGHLIEKCLSMFAPQIKSCSLLPYHENINEKIYKHLPFEEITEEEYKELIKDIKRVNWNIKNGEDAIIERGCTSDMCLLK